MFCFLKGKLSKGYHTCLEQCVQPQFSRNLHLFANLSRPSPNKSNNNRQTKTDNTDKSDKYKINKSSPSPQKTQHQQQKHWEEDTHTHTDTDKRILGCSGACFRLGSSTAPGPPSAARCPPSWSSAPRCSSWCWRGPSPRRRSRNWGGRLGQRATRLEASLFGVA